MFTGASEERAVAGDRPLARRFRVPTAAVALAASLIFFVGHLFFLAPTPASIDGVNFLLGVREFDVSDHRPHPPGYPLFISLGKATRALFPSSASEPADRLKAETRQLAIWSAIFGSLAVLPLLAIFRRLGKSERLAWAATLLTLTSPLFWMLAMRPLSDLPGLTVALVVQALVLMDVFDPTHARASGSTRIAVWRGSTGLAAGLLSGLSIGFRSQAVWLTVPLLAVAVRRRWRDDRTHALAMAVAFTVGVLIWAVPLVVASDGVAGYLQAFRLQAAEQWRDEPIWARSLAPTEFVRALVATLTSTFANALVAAVAGAFGLVALMVKILRRSDSAKWIAIMYGPYLAFHLALQDPYDARYALPLVPALAFLIARGLDIATGRLMPWLVAAFIAVSMSIVAPPVFAFAHAGNPVFRAIDDMRARLKSEAALTERPVLAMHHGVARMLRGQPLPMRTLPASPKKEWRELVTYWQSGGTSRVWFLAAPTRTDLSLIDGASRHVVQTYDWPFQNRALMTSAHPRGVVWHEIQPPGWMLDEGWSITPETGGVAFADRRGPSEQPIHAFVRRRPDAVTLLVGGRRPGARAPHRIEVRIDGQIVDAWSEDRGAFLETWEIPAGRLNGNGPYATVSITATGATTDPQPAIMIDQFDAQPQGAVIYGFESGWYEQELDPATGRSWRWTDRVAALRVVGPNRDVVLRVDAERPLNYLSRPPRIVVRAGAQILSWVVADADDDLSMRVRVPRAALAVADGVVNIETVWPRDRGFRPSDPNRPVPGLRVFNLSVDDASEKP